MFLLFVNKTRQAQTFFAIIEHDHWGYENVGNYFDSGAAHDFRGGLYRPASDKRSPDYTKGELKPLWCRFAAQNCLAQAKDFSER
jgi:hypothetical protein